MSSLLPVLSLLVHLVELHALPPDDEHTGPSSSSSSSSSGSPLSSAQSVQLLTAVLSVMENVNKLVSGVSIKMTVFVLVHVAIYLRLKTLYPTMPEFVLRWGKPAAGKC